VRLVPNDITLNAVIRNMPHTASENIATKVDALLKDDLKHRNVLIATAERMNSLDDRRPGVVVVQK
jgi:acetylglutamate synthase